MKKRNHFQKPRVILRSARYPSGQMLAGKSHPVIAEYFGQSEAGNLRQSVSLELAQISGRLITDVAAELTVIGVPIPAINALQNPEDQLPSNSEAFRDKMIAEETFTVLENEGEISKNCDINPIMVQGEAKVDEMVRLGYIVAQNYMRQRKYHKATLLDKTHTAIAPALFRMSTLEMLNGVLNPEDRVNGAVPLQGPDGKVYLKGIAKHNSVFATDPGGARAPGGQMEDFSSSSHIGDSATDYYYYIEEDPDNAGYPNLHINLSEQQLGNLSMSDFFRAEMMDDYTRTMDELIQQNPTVGEKLALRFAYGLDIETDNDPFPLYETTRIFNRSHRVAMDGANMDKVITNNTMTINYTLPVPKTEFGMMVYTFVSIKPDEALRRQPHPRLTRPYALRNYLEDDANIDPQPLHVRHLDSDCALADEETVAMHIGNNHLELSYVTAGFNRAVDTQEVANKSAVWQVGLPNSLTPDSPIYPSPVDIYPFVDNDPATPVCTYSVESVAAIASPLIPGPNPVEEIEIIEDENLFGDLVE